MVSKILWAKLDDKDPSVAKNFDLELCVVQHCQTFNDVVYVVHLLQVRNIGNRGRTGHQKQLNDVLQLGGLGRVRR